MAEMSVPGPAVPRPPDSESQRFLSFYERGLEAARTFLDGPLLAAIGAVRPALANRIRDPIGKAMAACDDYGVDSYLERLSGTWSGLGLRVVGVLAGPVGDVRFTCRRPAGPSGASLELAYASPGSSARSQPPDEVLIGSREGPSARSWVELSTFGATPFLAQLDWNHSGSPYAGVFSKVTKIDRRGRESTKIFYGGADAVGYAIMYVSGPGIRPDRGAIQIAVESGRQAARQSTDFVKAVSRFSIDGATSSPKQPGSGIPRMR
jgi:hypothetical protein